jgi:hypothetical protein
MYVDPREKVTARYQVVPAASLLFYYDMYMG